MARPRPPVSPYVPWPCSGTSTPTELALAATPRLVARRSTTSTASSTIPTGSTTCSSLPPWEVANYEPRKPIESALFQHGELHRTGRRPLQPARDAHGSAAAIRLLQQVGRRFAQGRGRPSERH